MRVVIPSVNYADFLALTLPAWRRLLPEAQFLVVSAPADRETQRVAAECGVPTLVTDVWTQGSDTFNKARALDLAFGFTKAPVPRPPEAGEWCLCLDADVYPFGPLWLPQEPGRILYGVHRYACPSPADFAAHRAGTLPLSHFELIRMWRKRRIPDPAGMQGYFQLWRYQVGDRFGSYPTAAKYDTFFARRFPRRQYLDAPYVLHLGEHRRNWTGRVTPRWDGAISQEMES